MALGALYAHEKSTRNVLEYKYIYIYNLKMWSIGYILQTVIKSCLYLGGRMRSQLHFYNATAGKINGI